MLPLERIGEAPGPNGGATDDIADVDDDDDADIEWWVLLIVGIGAAVVFFVVGFGAARAVTRG